MTSGVKSCVDCTFFGQSIILKVNRKGERYNDFKFVEMMSIMFIYLRIDQCCEFETSA